MCEPWHLSLFQSSFVIRDFIIVIFFFPIFDFFFGLANQASSDADPNHVTRR